MLIIDNNYIKSPLPIYEVQEVSLKEALALLKSDQRIRVEVSDKQLDGRLPITRGISPEVQQMGGINSDDFSLPYDEWDRA